jgi:5-methylcytosine-specific restriction endonuclease McrA
MRFIKLSPKLPEFKTLDGVRRFFLDEIPGRMPPGQFLLTPRHARDKLALGEPLVFVYQARVVFTARAGSEVLPYRGEERESYPAYFVVDLATLREADDDLRDVQRQFSEATRRPVGLVGQNWNRLPDSIDTTAVWERLRDAGNITLTEEIARLKRELDELQSETQPQTPEVLRKIQRVLKTCERPSPITRYVKRTHGATCQLCGELGFVKRNGQRYCEVHHLFHLSKNPPPNCLGPEYIVVLCATCHRRMHYADVGEPVRDVDGWRVRVDDAEYRFVTG